MRPLLNVPVETCPGLSINQLCVYTHWKPLWQVPEHQQEGRCGTHWVPAESSRGQSRINDCPAAANVVLPLQVWWWGNHTPLYLPTHHDCGCCLEWWRPQRGTRGEGVRPRHVHTWGGCPWLIRSSRVTSVICRDSTRSVKQCRAVVFPVLMGFLVCTAAAPPGIIVIHGPLGRLEAHYMHENTGGTELHAQIH